MAQASTPPLTFKIAGMDCAEEVAVLKQVVGPVAGGTDRLAFDILNGKMIVATTASGPTSDDIVKAVRTTGMRAAPWSAAEELAETSLWTRWGRTAMSTISGLMLVLGFLTHVLVSGGFSAALGSEGLGLAHEVPLIVRAMYAVAIISGSWFVAPKGWYALRRLRPDMNLLMTIAVIGAVGIGEWFEAATVASLFALSLSLEAWSVGRARRAIEALLELAPPIARVLNNGTFREVPPASVAVGARLLVKPGEKIPLDGVVRRGVSAVNQAPITGESTPVAKDVGSQVFAGTINGDGALELEATRQASDTTLANIIRMVGEASSQRAPSEQWVERFARIYTPAILAIAVLVLFVPPLAFGGSWSDWLYRSLVFLVIGCPCALVISTPVSIVAGLAAAARNGVLVKGGSVLEVPARLRAVALDKTGTLTRGQPEVQEVVALGGHSESELLERVAGLEAHSEHPLARAILNYSHSRGIKPMPVEDFRTLQGKGATGKLDGVEYWVGSHRYLEERGEETPEVHARLEAMTGASRSVVVVGDSTHVCGLIAIADSVRPEAASIVAALRSAGIEHIVMLTGDNLATAAAIGEATGVTEIKAELLPADKVKAVEELVARYGAVAMVGDGVNDAPAMARATMGIAMGVAGSDAAIETADVALMSDDLSKLPWLIRHSRRTLRIIRQNITLSLSVKVLFAILTFAGAASLWAAIGADMGVSLIVIANALRLLGGNSTGTDQSN
jgi:Zn2+/Cd2+-exporting ATPase